MIQKKVVTSNEPEWNELIKVLEIFKSREQYHRILETIKFCIKMIEEKHWDSDDVRIFEGLCLLLDGCKQLVDYVKEYYYSKELGAIVLNLVEALKMHAALSDQKIIKNFIDDCLPYTNESLILYKPLCDHKYGSVEDFFPSHLPNPYHELVKIHTECQRMVQFNLERYREAAIVTNVVDYWRTLFSMGKVSGDIQPLLELGEDLLGRIKECSDPKRKNVLWKMVLLLQMLLRYHPAVKALKSQGWPAEGFVQSLLPFEYQSSSLTQECINKLPYTLLKDYRLHLQASRLIFEDVIKSTAGVFKAQKKHTRQVIKMLEEMILATRKLLGAPPCEIVVCILGSTSRYDRRPYSDFEYMILHSEVPGDKNKVVDFYICHFISLFELMIISLGEISSEHNKNGFKIDQSLLGLTVSTKSKSWGTPKEVVKKYVSELDLPPHGWIDKGLFEYLHPIAVECPELGSRTLFESYIKELDSYLNQVICENDSPQVITKLFKIKEDWWQGLTRRQGIALSSLCKMLDSVENVDLDVKAGRQVNLKSHYYKPLLYCALSLGMYEGVQALTPSKTIQAYCATMSWGGEALLLWWQSALEYVVKEQIKQHLRYRGQDDSMIMREDECWAGFDLIVEGFILPLQEGVRECLSGSLPISMLGYVILKGYLNIRHAWLARWVSMGIALDALLAHPLLQPLAAYPDESGWSPQMEVVLKCHHEGLLKLSSNRITGCEFAGLTVQGKQHPRYLKEEILRECFKAGKFVGDPELSSERSQVKKLMVGDKIWYVKVKEGNIEGLMAREYLAMMLHLLLGGKPQIALGWPIKLTNANEGVSYAWISEGVPGESFGVSMRNCPNTWKSFQFKRENFSQLFLFTFLTCPEDGQPENFKAIIEDNKIILIAIDYGQCFVVADRTEKRKERGDFFSSEVSVLTIKTLIYLFEAMNELLSANLITRIRLLDVDAWYLNWKSSLEGINEIFNSLLEKDLNNVPKMDEDKSNRLITIPEGVLLCIKSRLTLLQHWLRTTQKPITGQSILESLEPLVASQYAFLKPIIETPEDFYQNIDVKAYVKDIKSGKMISSATWTTLQQQALNPQQLARSCDLEPSYFRCVEFWHLTWDQQEYQLQLLESVAQSKGKDFVELDLRGSLIEEHRLISLLEKMPQLKLLNLTHCSRLGVMTLTKLLAHRPNATVLTYNFDVLCPKLHAIRMTLDDANFTMMLDLTFEQRRSLSTKMKDFVARYDRVVKSFYKLLSDKDHRIVTGAAITLARLCKVDKRIIETLLRSYRNHAGQVKRDVGITLVRICKDEPWVIELLLSGLKEYLKKRSNKLVMSAQEKLFSGDDVLHKTFEVLGNLRSARGRKILVEDRTIDALLGVVNIGNDILDEEALSTLYSLGESNGRAVEALIKALNYPNKEIQINAARKLASLGKTDNQMIGVWLYVLSNKYPISVRESAIKALGKLERVNERVINALMMELCDREMSIRLLVVATLVRLGRVDKRMMAALWRTLGDSNMSLRQYAAQALASLGKADDSVIELLREGLSNPDEVLSVGAARALVYLGNADNCVVEALRQALMASVCERKLKLLALEAIVHLGDIDDHTLKILVWALNNPEAKIKYLEELLSYLCEIDDRILEALIVSLVSPKNSVRIVAKEVLFYLDRHRLIKILERSISTIFRRLKQNNEPIIMALLSAQLDSDEFLRNLSAHILDLLPEELLTSLKDLDLKAIKPLESSSKSDYRVIRTKYPFDKLGPCIAMIQGMIYVPDEWVINAFIMELKKAREADKSMSIIEDLKELCVVDERAMSMLLKEMDDPDEGVRQKMVDVIGQLGLVNTQIIEILLKVLSSSNEGVQQSVVNALVKLKVDRSEVGIIALLKAMDDTEDAVRRCAAKVIVQLNSEIVRLVKGVLQLLGGHIVWSSRELFSELERLYPRNAMIIEGVLKAMYDSDKTIRQLEPEDFRILDEEDFLVIEAVVKVMCNPDKAIRQVDLEALGQLDKVGTQIIEALLRGPYHSDNKVESLINVLLRELGDLKSRRRLLALITLKRIGKLNDRVVDTMLKLLIELDTDYEIREYALEGLRELLSPKNYWNRIQHEITQFPSGIPAVLEEQALQDVPELRLPSSIRPPQPPFYASFFRNRSIDMANESDEEVDDVDESALGLVEDQRNNPALPGKIDDEWVVIPREDKKALK